MRYGGAIYQLEFHCKNFKWGKMKNKYFLLLEWEVSYLELEFNDVKNIKYQRETSIYHSWIVNIV